MEMNAALQFLVHYFNHKEYIFKTIMMAGSSEVEEICDRITAQKGWFWGRFAPSERQDYLLRRRFVEKELYEEYTKEYGSLKERVPVYFYLYPNVTIPKIIEWGRLRASYDETQPHILIVKIADIEDTGSITFTLNDSFTAYRSRVLESGIPCRGDTRILPVLPDHNRVFPFSMIEQIHRKYQAQEIYYEIQVWDYQLLEKIPFQLLETGEPDQSPR